MGTFTVPLQVGDLAGQQFIDVEALVDTGATYTSIPESTFPSLDWLLPCDGASHRIVPFVPYQGVHAITFSEPFGQVSFMLPDALSTIGGDAQV